MTPCASGHGPVDEPRHDADVVVVGAGPSGSSAAYWLANAGLDVVLLEKTSFPREKVCGDGLTPRGTRALVDMGIDVSESAGWLHNRGLRVIGGGQRLQLDWPELTSFPTYGLVRPRADLDALLANQAVKAGARLHEQTTVTEPMLDAAGRVCGRARGRTADKAPVEYRAPLVLSLRRRLGQAGPAPGRAPQRQAPAGGGRPPLLHQPATHDDYLESLARALGRPARSRRRNLLPGYGWIFGMGDGTVNAGLGVLNSSAGFQQDRLPRPAHPLAGQHARGVGAARGRTPPARRGAPALPMGFNRSPHYLRGLLLVGDSGGSVNPFNGEGIPYAIESGKFAAEAVDPGAGPAGGPGAGAGAAGLSAAAAAGVGRVLPARRDLREADRQPEGDAGLHPPRPAASRR